MKKISATDAKNRFGELLDQAQAGPVAIQKNGRDVAYIVSKDEFERRNEELVNPLVLQYHEESIRKFDASYKRLAE